MARVLANVLISMAVLLATGPAVPMPAIAAPAVSQDTGVYEEGFATYAHKGYVENAEWDVWVQTLRLARTDSIEQYDPAVAMDGDGNAFIVWRDCRSSRCGVYAQRFTADGNRLWAADVCVASGSEAESPGNPAVALDGSGNAIVVWSDHRNGDLDIYTQKLDGNGSKLWAADMRVNSDSGVVSQSTPTVSVGRNGNAIVVWWDGRNGDGDVYAQKLDGNGNRLWAADAQVNLDGGAAERGYPVVAVDTGGNAVVTWWDERNGDWDIYAQRLGGNGSRLWVADVRVNSDSGTADQFGPTVAVDGGGNAIIVWYDCRDGNAGIYAQRLDGNGNKLWAADVHTDDIGWDPVVAMDGSGNAILVWYDYRNGDSGIYAQKLDRNGEKLWAADMWVNSNGARQYGILAVAADGSGSAIIVWGDDRSGDYDIYAQKLDGSGNRLWMADVRVNSDSGTASQRFPAVAVSTGGDSIVVWEDTRNGNLDIYAQRLDGIGNRLWAADMRVNPVSGTIYQGYPVVATDGGGNAIVVWSDRCNDDGDIYAQKFDGNGNRLWVDEVRVNSDSGMGSQWSPAVAVDGNGNVIVVWSEDGRKVYAQRLDRSGSKQWAADVRVDSGGGTTYKFGPDVAVGNDGSAVIVWTDERNGGYEYRDIYAQMLDEAGSKLWVADVPVNSDHGIGVQDSPAVAVGGSGRAIVVWTDDRSGRDGIYAQMLDETGSKLWPVDLRVNSDGGNASYYAPDVTIDESGNAFLVWEDERNADADIYGQRLDRHGTKLWPVDMPVNSDGGAVAHTHPAVALDGSGNAIAVWMDSRNGNADIYAQKIDSLGSQIWLADLQVVYPDRFYLPIGTAQSRTIDTVTGDIRGATLTADYQTNGGEMQFYLTNDGGVYWSPVTPGVTHVFTTTGSDLRWRAVLSVDPIWRHRTPVVSSLRIEYSTQVPYYDNYEPDDDCLSQARPIAVNGGAQAHTFHQQADADWVWFDIVAGATYIVETYNVGSRAQTVAEPHRTCTAPPAGTGRPFGNGYTFSFTADQTGRYYVKVYNHTPSVYGQDTDYTLSVRSVRPNAVAVVVAGHDDYDTYQDSILYAADRAYRVFLNAGLGKANVRYLAPLASHDADGDGANDVAGWSSPANVRDAVQDWARERGVALGVPLYVYLVDHGVVDRFKADGDALAGHVTAADLNLWLSNVEATTGADNVNVILDACYSGSFIDVTTVETETISGRNRVVVTSTTSEWEAYGPPGGEGLYFSNAFFSALENEQSLWASYLAGREAVGREGVLQEPWLDDNGDRRSDIQDGALAAGRALRRVAMRGNAPQIEWLSASGDVIRAKVVDDSAWVGVKVEVFGPSYEPPVPDGSGTTRIVDVPVVGLTDPNSDGTYEGTHVFTETGVYRLVAHAEDAEGNLALPVARLLPMGHTIFLPLVLR